MNKIKKKRSSKIIRVTIRQHHITSAKSKDAYSVQKDSEIQSAYSSSKNQVIVFISS